MPRRKPKQLRTCLLCEATSAGTLVTFTHKRDICDACHDDLTRRGLAWCARGRHKVAVSDMSKRGSCRACNNARARAHLRSDNSARSKAWRAANRDRARAYRQRPDVRERRRANAYALYWRDPERHRAYSRADYERRRAAVATHRRLRYRQRGETERAARISYYQQVKARAWATLLQTGVV